MCGGLSNSRTNRGGGLSNSRTNRGGKALDYGSQLHTNPGGKYVYRGYSAAPR